MAPLPWHVVHSPHRSASHFISVLAYIVVSFHLLWKSSFRTPHNSHGFATSSEMMHDFSRQKSELVTCVAEVAFGEREDPGGLDGEHKDRIWEDLVFIIVVKAAVAHQVFPSSIPRGRPHRG